MEETPGLGSAVGGIQDQVVEGTGVLLRDPTDLAAFGSAVRQLLDNPGKAGQEHIREHFVGDCHLLQWAQHISAAELDLGLAGKLASRLAGSNVRPSECQPTGML